MNDPRLAELLCHPRSIRQIESADHPKAEMVQRCVAALGQPDGAAVAYFVPGRVEVLGKHTDYCGGRSLICAIDRGFVVVARRRDDSHIRISATGSDEHATFSIAGEEPPVMGHWSNYPMTVARRIAANFSADNLTGADVAFASDLPRAAGLSSSSALVVASFLALASLNRLDRSAAFARDIQTLEDLAHYCGCIENGSSFRGLAGHAGVGTTGGSQDHVAILCGRSKQLSQYRFAPVVHEREVDLPEDWSLVVLNSGVMAEKTGAARERYNAVSRKARRLVELWNAAHDLHHPTLASIVRCGAEAVEQLRRLASQGSSPFSSQELLARLDQFVDESERIIPEAADAVASADRAAFARLAVRSTAGAVEGLANQVPQTLALTAAAVDGGAFAASPFGAGFGGSVWAMVDAARTAAFVAAMQSLAAGVFPVRPAAGAHAIT